jgi:hypothetical protein
MRPIEQPFEIESNGIVIKVSEHVIADERVFHLVFPDKRKELNLIVAEERPSGKRFWTSTPEGRQEEAEQFGKLIADHIRKKRSQSKDNQNAG